MRTALTSLPLSIAMNAVDGQPTTHTNDHARKEANQ
jgi:hypothetical protein